MSINFDSSILGQIPEDLLNYIRQQKTALPPGRTFAGYTNPLGQLLPPGVLSQSAQQLPSAGSAFLNSGNSALPSYNPLTQQLAQRFGAAPGSQTKSTWSQGFPGIFGGMYGGAQ